MTCPPLPGGAGTRLRPADSAAGLAGCGERASGRALIQPGAEEDAEGDAGGVGRGMRDVSRAVGAPRGGGRSEYRQDAAWVNDPDRAAGGRGDPVNGLFRRGRRGVTDRRGGQPLGDDGRDGRTRWRNGGKQDDRQDGNEPAQRGGDSRSVLRVELTHASPDGIARAESAKPRSGARRSYYTVCDLAGTPLPISRPRAAWQSYSSSWPAPARPYSR